MLVRFEDSGTLVRTIIFRNLTAYETANGPYTLFVQLDQANELLMAYHLSCLTLAF